MLGPGALEIPNAPLSHQGVGIIQDSLVATTLYIQCMQVGRTRVDDNVPRQPIIGRIGARGGMRGRETKSVP